MEYRPRKEILASQPLEIKEKAMLQRICILEEFYRPYHLATCLWRKRYGDIHLEESVKMTLDPDIKLYKSTLYEVKNLTEKKIKYQYINLRYRGFT